MTALLPSLEEAEVGSRSLDVAVWIALSDDPNAIDGQHGWVETRGRAQETALVTTSLDAALALAERLWPHVMWRVGHDPDDGSFKAQMSIAQKPGDPPAVHANAATPALALCAAIIRAKEAV